MNAILISVVNGRHFLVSTSYYPRLCIMKFLMILLIIQLPGDVHLRLCAELSYLMMNDMFAYLLSFCSKTFEMVVRRRWPTKLTRFWSYQFFQICSQIQISEIEYILGKNIKWDNYATLYCKCITFRLWYGVIMLYFIRNTLENWLKIMFS